MPNPAIHSASQRAWSVQNCEKPHGEAFSIELFSCVIAILCFNHVQIKIAHPHVSPDKKGQHSWIHVFQASVVPFLSFSLPASFLCLTDSTDIYRFIQTMWDTNLFREEDKGILFRGINNSTLFLKKTDFLHVFQTKIDGAPPTRRLRHRRRCPRLQPDTDGRLQGRRRRCPTSWKGILMSRAHSYIYIYIWVTVIQYT